MHRKADALAEILESRRLPGGVAAARQRYADLWDELEPLVILAEVIRELRPEGPDGTRRLGAWERVLARLHTAPALPARFSDPSAGPGHAVSTLARAG